MGTSLDITGSATGAISAVGAVNKEIDKTEKAAAKAAAEMRRLEAEAKKIAANVDPLAKWNQQMDRLDVLAAKGVISQEHLTAAVRKYSAELSIASQSAKPLANNLHSVGAAGGGAFGPAAIAQLGSYLAGVLSIHAAIAAVRSSIEAVRQENERARQSTLTAAEGEAELRKNIIAFRPKNQERLLAAGRQIAAAQNLPVAPIFTALANTASATGKTGLSINLTDVASQFTRVPAEIPVVAGGLGDFVSAGAAHDATEALGELSLIHANSRVVNPADVAKNAAKVVAKFTSPKAGGTAAYGGALFASLTRGAADPTGELSRTAAILLSDQTAAFFKGNRGFRKDQTDTVDERLDLLLGDQKLGADFIAKTKLRAPVSGAVEKLFLGDKTVRDAFFNARADLRDPNKVRAEARRALAFVREGPLQSAAIQEGAISSALEQLGINGGLGGDFSEESRDRVFNLSHRLRGADIGTAGRFGFFLRTGPTLSQEEAIGELSTAADFAAGQNPNDASQKQITAARKIVSELQKLNAKQTSRVTTRQN